VRRLSIGVGVAFFLAAILRLLLITIGILVPIWSIWLGVRFGSASSPAPA
jgi:hypothetical protein